MKNKLFIFGFVSCLSNSIVAMNCEVANQLAIDIYSRAYEANKNKDLKVAFAHKDDFWDMEKYAKNCEKVKENAQKLIKSNMSKYAQAPKINDFYVNIVAMELPQPIKDVCLGKNGCTIVVKSGSVADVNGYVVPKVFEFSQSGSNKNLIEWKQLESKDPNKIFVPDFRETKPPAVEWQAIPKPLDQLK